MVSPLVTPNMITSAPTGISWDIIPFPQATTPEQLAEQYNMCWRATQIVDGYVNQVFRATIDTEYRNGPGDYRININQYNGTTRWILSRWPVLSVLAGQVSTGSTFPRQWTQIPANMMEVENPAIGIYNSTVPAGSGGAGGQSITIAPGFGTWAAGRQGMRFSATYINGWPHCGLIANSVAGATTLTVDDVTGFVGATAMIYDGINTESITISSVTANTNVVLPNGGGTAPGGPGTLTLSSPTLFAHGGSVPAEVIISTVPSDVLWATILACASQALEAGITSISIQNLPGSLTEGGHGVTDLKVEYETILEPYKRVI